MLIYHDQGLSIFSGYFQLASVDKLHDDLKRVHIKTLELHTRFVSLSKIRQEHCVEIR